MHEITYESTRGGEHNLDLSSVLLNGLARDGGLYVPQQLPHFSKQALIAMRQLNYGELSAKILQPFLGKHFPQDLPLSIMQHASKSFSHRSLAPLTHLDRDIWMLELFHGPTLAFKDFGMQMLAGLLEDLLAKRNRKMVIVGATSGDTGSAAIHAFKGHEHIQICMLHPAGRVSDFQRAQMTSVLDKNVHNIAVEGSFDDCQDLVKAMFNDDTLRDQLKLGAVNSINWGRILAQIIYYFWAALRLGAPERPVSFVVPSGNFGNVFAGWLARSMGLNIPHLVVASNHNDILTRFFHHNDMSVQAVKPSLSPSMDIQISSNFERLLYSVLGRNAQQTNKQIQSLRNSGSMNVPTKDWQALTEIFLACKASDQDTLAQINHTYQQTQYILDPHTAVGMFAAQNLPKPLNHPLVVLATAHPAKFADCVYKAIGFEAERPKIFHNIESKPERVTQIKANQDTLKQILLDINQTSIS